MIPSETGTSKLKTPPRIAILGAGLSGLSAAWFLKKKGLTSVLFEGSSRTGGVIQSSSEQGYLFEHGPNSLFLNGGDLEELINDLQIDGPIVEANRHAKKRFIVRDGKVLPVPLSAGAFISTPLLSAKAKFRLLCEPFQRRCKGTDESLASFSQRRLGKEVLDYLLNPFVSGVYAGNPEKLSARYAFPSLWEMEQKHGSLLKGLLRRSRKKDLKSKRRIISFKDGIQTLTSTLTHQVRDQLLLNETIHTIRQENGQWLINGQCFNAVISSIPMYQLPSLQSEIRNQESEISYSPLSVWHLGFRREHIRHPLDGFGMLVPEVETMNILGCLFPSTLFPGRAPKDHVLLTVFLGGSRQPELAGLPEEDSLALVLEDLDRLLGLQGKPVWNKYLHWDKAIPQYGLGHGFFLKTLSDFEESHPGWFFAGNYRDGISVPNCVSGGKRSALALLKYLDSLNPDS